MFSSRCVLLRGALLVWMAAAAYGQAALNQVPPSPPPLAFPGGAGTALGQKVAAITGEPEVARAHWGVAVTALDGTPVYGLNEGQMFRPASNTKLFTTAAAMALLRTNDGLETKVTGRAPDSNGTMGGNLSLTGHGDANISDRVIPYQSPAERKRKEAEAQGQPPASAPITLAKIDAVATKLVEKGLKRVVGDVVGTDAGWPWEPYPNDWSIDDAVWGYGAPVSALTINDNQLELTVAPGAATGANAVVTLKPDLGYYRIEANVQTVAAKQPANVRVERTIGSRVLRVFGTIAMDAPDTEEVAIEDPAEFAALALKKAVEAHGVKVDGTARARHRLSDSVEGFTQQVRTPVALNVGTGLSDDYAYPVLSVPINAPTLAEDVAVTLKVSQNLHAELLLRRLGKEYGTDGTAAQGARVVRQFLLNAGVDGDDFVFYDGSGLSGHDLVTPRATAKLLSYAAGQPWFAAWKAGLPVGGEDGTLAGRFGKSTLKDHLFAKTGTLSEARALSGYVDCASGKTMIFSVMVDNHTPVTTADREAMDRIVEAIAAAE